MRSLSQYNKQVKNPYRSVSSENNPHINKENTRNINIKQTNKKNHEHSYKQSYKQSHKKACQIKNCETPHKSGSIKNSVIMKSMPQSKCSKANLNKIKKQLCRHLQYGNTKKQSSSISNNQNRKIYKILEVIDNDQSPSFGDIAQSETKQNWDEYVFDEVIKSSEPIIPFIYKSVQKIFAIPQVMNIVINDVCKHTKQKNAEINGNNQNGGIDKDDKKQQILVLLTKYLKNMLSDSKISCYKNLISIYMQENKQPYRIYDMLSIRREIKSSEKQFVKTYVSGKEKSGIILNKLIEFAKHRENLNKSEGFEGNMIIRIQSYAQCNQIIQSLSKDNEKSVLKSLIQISYQRKLAPKFLNYTQFNLYRAQYNCKQHLSIFLKPLQKNSLTKKGCEISQQNLLAHIKTLHSQLELNKKQLEEYKGKYRQKLQQDMQDGVPPSERVRINLQKYESRNKMEQIKCKRNIKIMKHKTNNNRIVNTHNNVESDNM